MAATAETLEQYFQQYGWTYDRVGESDFRTGFRGDVSSFRIHVRLTENWIYFSISPFVVAPQDPECERKLYHHLLRMNQEMNLAKFTVDGDGDVILTVELPSASLDYGEFADAMGALVYYADDNYAKAFVLAHVPAAHAALDDKQELDWGAE